MPPAVGVLPEGMDIEASPAACCRICLASEGGELISPCMCKGTQQFVHRACLDHWRAVKVIAAIAGVAYLLDRGGKFRKSFAHHGDHILSVHPVVFYYIVGVVVFFALTGLCGLLLHCFSSDHTDPECLGVCSYGCMDCSECLDCFASSGEASCIILAVVVVIVFAIPGVIYGCIAVTMAFQNIMQRHYHILHKKDLTKVYIVEDLQRGYAPPPKTDPVHEQRLKMLQLM